MIWYVMRWLGLQKYTTKLIGSKLLGPNFFDNPPSSSSFYSINSILSSSCLLSISSSHGRRLRVSLSNCQILEFGYKTSDILLSKDQTWHYYEECGWVMFLATCIVRHRFAFHQGWFAFQGHVIIAYFSSVNFETVSNFLFPLRLWPWFKVD